MDAKLSLAFSDFLSEFWTFHSPLNKELFLWLANQIESPTCLSVPDSVTALAEKLRHDPTEEEEIGIAFQILDRMIPSSESNELQSSLAYLLIVLKNRNLVLDRYRDFILSGLKETDKTLTTRLLILSLDLKLDIGLDFAIQFLLDLQGSSFRELLTSILTYLEVSTESAPFSLFQILEWSSPDLARRKISTELLERLHALQKSQR
jgi:hypothetical protein